MWTRALLKQNGKQAFLRNYWTCVLVSAIAVIMTGGLGVSTNYSFNQEDAAAALDGKSVYELVSTMPMHIMMLLFITAMIGFVVGICVAILVSNVIQVGHIRYYLENREHKTNVGQLFYGFQNGRYGTTVLIMFLRGLYVFGWSLLLLVPGIIKAYAYSMVPYILAENPELDRKRIFELSSKMMEGHKWEAFELSLSFIGWVFLGVFTSGMTNIFYTQPYLCATFAEFYSALKAEAKMKGILYEGELPGILPKEEVI